MLHFFRQHRQAMGLLLMPALMLVWLSFSCQNCFADNVSESAQKMHAAMDCCPSEAHSEHGHADGQGCEINYLVKQPAIADEAAALQTDLQVVILPVAEARYTVVQALLLQPKALYRDPHSFSDRHFSSYRILLI